MTPRFIGKMNVFRMLDDGCKVALVVALLCLVPLFLTPAAPLVDFYAHVHRYFVLSEINDNAIFLENYGANWQLLPNLGLDIIGVGLMSLLPPLIVGKALIALILAAQFLGVVYLAKTLHGRVTPESAFLAGTLVYSHILVWGFANFLLGLGLALASVGLWISLRKRPVLQWATAAVIALLLLIVHGLAFAMWGLLLGAVELTIAWRDEGFRFGPLALRMSRLAALAIAPTVLFLTMSTSAAGGAAAFSNVAAHIDAGTIWPELIEEALNRIDGVLRVTDSQFPWGDRLFGVALWGVLAVGLLMRSFRIHRLLWLACLVAGLLLLVLPPNMFGIGHLEERPPLLLLCLISAGLKLEPNQKSAKAFRVALAVLFVSHVAMVAVSWANHGQAYRQFMAKTDAEDLSGKHGVRLAVAMFVNEDQGRDAFSPNCKPMMFLLSLQGRLAVPTFAYAHAQPMTLAGRLESALKTLTASAEGNPMLPTPENRDFSLAIAFDSGFDAVIACEDQPRSPSLTADVIVEGGNWVIYGKPDR